MATILIVDDDPDVLILVRSILERAGHQVVALSDPTEVAARAAELAADVVILDIQMPGVSGYDVLRELRGALRTGGVPILFLSAMSRSEDRVRGLREGADDFLTKPFAPEELKLRIERLVARRSGATGVANGSSAGNLEELVRDRRVVGQVYLGRYQALEVVGEGVMGLSSGAGIRSSSGPGAGIRSSSGRWPSRRCVSARS